MQAHNTHYIHYVCNCLMNSVCFLQKYMFTLFNLNIVIPVREYVTFALAAQPLPTTIDPQH